MFFFCLACPRHAVLSRLSPVVQCTVLIPHVCYLAFVRDFVDLLRAQCYIVFFFCDLTGLKYHVNWFVHFATATVHAGRWKCWDARYTLLLISTGVQDCNDHNHIIALSFTVVLIQHHLTRPSWILIASQYFLPPQLNIHESGGWWFCGLCRRKHANNQTSQFISYAVQPNIVRDSVCDH